MIFQTVLSEINCLIDCLIECLIIVSYLSHNCLMVMSCAWMPDKPASAVEKLLMPMGNDLFCF